MPLCAPTPAEDEPSSGPYRPYRADSLVVEHDGPVTVVTINRPERRNAVDSVCADQLREAFVAFDGDEERSVAVLTGTAGTFCAGADLKAVAEGDRRPIPDDGPGPMGPTRLTLGKPVIAAVEGYAVAGGIELALWCDLRVAAEDAIFGVFCRRFGVPLCDLGTVRLPRIVGHGRAMDLILTGRAVPAPEALTMGLANRVVAPGEALAAAVALAHQLAALPQICLRSDRMSALEQWGLTEEEAARNEARRGRDVVSSGETLEGARPVRGRCRPSWRCARLTTPPNGARPPARPTVAAFDFDGTLTDGGSAFPFLVSLRGLWPVLRATLRLSPALLRAAITGGTAADEVKEKLFHRLLGGLSVAELDRRSAVFAHRHLQRHLRADTRRRLEWHQRQGHYTVIVSASPECYVSPAGEELGVDGVVATRLAVGGGGLLTGGYEGKNCRGRGEVRPARRPPQHRAACSRTRVGSSRCCGPTATAAVICACSTRRTMAWTPGAWVPSGACAGSPGSPRWSATSE